MAEVTQDKILKNPQSETLVAVRLDNLDAWLLLDPSEAAELPAGAGRAAVVRIRTKA